MPANAERIAIPSASSRMHAPAFGFLTEVAGLQMATINLRTLWFELADGRQIVCCRGSDVPKLVGLGVADVGVTGYDVAVEEILAGGVELNIFAAQPVRTSFVSFVGVRSRAKITRLYTEYPNITRAWLGAGAPVGSDALIVEVQGSSEGIIRSDDSAGGVLLVTSGETLQQNGLDLSVPLLATDLCFVTRASASGHESSLSALYRSPLGLPDFCK